MTRSRPPTRSRFSSRTCAASSSPRASRACCTRSGEPATSFVRRPLDAIMRAARRISASFERLPIRVRLAGVSALLTFVILCAFALTIGWITVPRLRNALNRQVNDTPDKLRSQLRISAVPGVARRIVIEPPLSAFASPSEHAVIRIYTIGGGIIAQQPAQAPSLGEPKLLPASVHGYRVVSRPVPVRVSGTDELLGEMVARYGRRVSDPEATVAPVELFLLRGVVAGTALALLAGRAIARRAIKAIPE